MRTLSYVNFLKSGAEGCENLVLMCIDFRFHKQISDLISYAGYRDFDIVALPGASKSLVDEQSRVTVLNAISRAKELHGINRVIIVDHVDCRAYGGSAAFADSRSEEEHHDHKLEQASAIVRENFPDLEVIQLYADWDRLKQR